jgi:hypothetical protein
MTSHKQEIDMGDNTVTTHPAIRFERYVDRSGDCHLWTGYITDHGYGTFSMSRKRGAVQAHRAAWELAFGPIGEGLKICHNCDNKKCVNVNHLFAGTQAANIQDKMNKSRQAKGETHGMSKLTEADVLAIRASGKSQRALAKEYGVTHPLIGNIKRRENWTHI